MSAPLPSARTDSLHSFYEFSVSAREQCHESLGWAVGPSRRGRPGTGTSTTSTTTASPAMETSGPRGVYAVTTLGALDEKRSAARRARERVARRALRGERPAGSALAFDAQDLSDEEEAHEMQRSGITAFGHRFLMPIGRMMTAMEMEAAPSPTPSDADHQQEDRNGDVTPLASPGPEVDLDASIEDRDADMDADDSLDQDDARSTEYDSDDLRLMRAMDRSVGSRTPASDEEDMEEDEV